MLPESAWPQTAFRVQIATPVRTASLRGERRGRRRIRRWLLDSEPWGTDPVPTWQAAVRERITERRLRRRHDRDPVREVQRETGRTDAGRAGLGGQPRHRLGICRDSVDPRLE